MLKVLSGVFGYLIRSEVKIIHTSESFQYVVIEERSRTRQTQKYCIHVDPQSKHNIHLKKIKKKQPNNDINGKLRQQNLL